MMTRWAFIFIFLVKCFKKIKFSSIRIGFFFCIDTKPSLKIKMPSKRLHEDTSPDTYPRGYRCLTYNRKAEPMLHTEGEASLSPNASYGAASSFLQGQLQLAACFLGGFSHFGQSLCPTDHVSVSLTVRSVTIKTLNVWSAFHPEMPEHSRDMARSPPQDWDHPLSVGGHWRWNGGSLDCVKYWPCFQWLGKFSGFFFFNFRRLSFSGRIPKERYTTIPSV